MKAFTVWDWIVTSSKSSQLPQTLVTYWVWDCTSRTGGLFSDFSNQICGGWGVRTSAKNPAYNPISYQLGSVWLTILLLQLD